MNYVLFQTVFKIHSKNTGHITTLYFTDIIAYISLNLIINNYIMLSGRKSVIIKQY